MSSIARCDSSFLEAFVPASAKWLSSVTSGEVMQHRAHAALLLVDMNDFVKMCTCENRCHELDRAPLKHIRQEIHGCRRLAEASASHGRLLRTVLAEYFTRLANIVSAYDGMVVAFLGDAMLAAWLVDCTSETDERVFDAVRHAYFSAHSILNHVHGCTLSDFTDVQLKLMISTGPVVLLPISAREMASDVLLAGEAVNELRAMKNEMKSGNVILNKLSRVILTRATGSSSFTSTNSAVDRFHRECTSSLMNYVPRHALNAFYEGLVDASELNSVSEECTIMFVRFDPARREIDHIEWMRTTAILIRRCVSENHGTVRQTVVDENGPACLSVFGLGHAQKRAAATRAVRCAQQIIIALRDLETRATCGLSTGIVDTGTACVVSSSDQCEITCIGVPVVLAARLAEDAADGTIVIDKETRMRASTRLVHVTRASVHLKGFGRRVSIFVIQPEPSYHVI